MVLLNSDATTTLPAPSVHIPAASFSDGSSGYSQTVTQLSPRQQGLKQSLASLVQLACCLFFVSSWNLKLYILSFCDKWSRAWTHESNATESPTEAQDTSLYIGVPKICLSEKLLRYRDTARKCCSMQIALDRQLKRKFPLQSVICDQVSSRSSANGQMASTKALVKTRKIFTRGLSSYRRVTKSSLNQKTKYNASPNFQNQYKRDCLTYYPLQFCSLTRFSFQVVSS